MFKQSRKKRINRFLKRRGFFVVVVVFCIIDKKERKRIQVFAQIPVD